MTDNQEIDRDAVWLIDLDGTGSMHPASKGDRGAVAYVPKQAYLDLYEAYMDTKRLAREIDVAMHGEEGAAQQASLCDLVHPAADIRAERDALQAENRKLMNGVGDAFALADAGMLDEALIVLAALAEGKTE